MKTPRFHNSPTCELLESNHAHDRNQKQFSFGLPPRDRTTQVTELRGYGSLHEYLVDELKCSDGAAHRRIKSMQPFVICEVKRARLENFRFRAQVEFKVFSRNQENKVSCEEKKDLVELVQGKSTAKRNDLGCEIPVANFQAGSR